MEIKLMICNMLFRQYLFLLVFSLICLKPATVDGLIDPVTGAFAIGAFVAGYFFHKSKHSFPFYDSCPRSIDIDELQYDMDKNFFGQHIASKIILSALKGNSRRSSSNKKPLVMSFHGWTGSGKNFIADLIATHMFKTEKVQKLRHHMFNGRSDFLLQSKANTYKEELLEKIRTAIKSCDTNLFVFDELHYMPMGMLDVLIPILENHDQSIDSRNSIFMFLTNAGSDAIVKKYLELWDKGYSREQMKVKDFDSVLQISAFNEIGALKRSQMIDSHIIDHFVPFLPLEKSHLIQCIDAELKHLNKFLDSKEKDELLQIIPFGPEPQKLFSTSGCKRIKALVTTETNSNLI